MNDPQSICVGLEQARALKEAGWAQDGSNFYHTTFYRGYEYEDLALPELRYVGTGTILLQEEWSECLGLLRDKIEDDPKEEDRYREYVWYAAPTAEEIFNRLNGNLLNVGYEAYLQLTMLGGGRYMLRYMGRSEPPNQPVIQGSLVNALSDMYCYLAENNLLIKQ